MKDLSQAIGIAALVREYLKRNHLIDKNQQEEVLKNQEKILKQLKNISRISK